MSSFIRLLILCYLLLLLITDYYGVEPLEKINISSLPASVAVSSAASLAGSRIYKDDDKKINLKEADMTPVYMIILLYYALFPVYFSRLIFAPISSLVLYQYLNIVAISVMK